MTASTRKRQAAAGSSSGGRRPDSKIKQQRQAGGAASGSKMAVTEHQHQEPVAETPTTAAAVPPLDRPIRVYADGIWDAFHYGHARALEQAKKLFPNAVLVVGVCNDEDTHRYKGRTLMTEEERYESVRHCRWVDEVVRDAPWVVTLPFLEKHNIDYVAHDDLPYADASGQADDVYGIVKRAGRFLPTQRTGGISTSDLILRVLRDYNEYVMRNLQRGYTRKQLGISLVKEQRIRASARLKQLREQWGTAGAVAQQHLAVAGGRISKRWRLPRLSLQPPTSGAGAVGSTPKPGVRRVSKSGLAAQAHGKRGGLSIGELLERSGWELATMLRRQGEELAAGVELMVGKVLPGPVRAELLVVGGQMDSFMSSCVRVLEDSYSRLEQLALRPLRPW